MQNETSFTFLALGPTPRGTYIWSLNWQNIYIAFLKLYNCFRSCLLSFMNFFLFWLLGWLPVLHYCNYTIVNWYALGYQQQTCSKIIIISWLFLFGSFIHTQNGSSSFYPCYCFSSSFSLAEALLSQFPLWLQFLFVCVTYWVQLDVNKQEFWNKLNVWKSCAYNTEDAHAPYPYLSIIISMAFLS